ncbi:hypothetical protein DFH09DRAFT_596631 [Mycena vulgaris]|nr:hypothetical protein DFH09DRAFT_596631 [Mycena vulgaris]
MQLEQDARFQSMTPNNDVPLPALIARIVNPDPALDASDSTNAHIRPAPALVFTSLRDMQPLPSIGAAFPHVSHRAAACATPDPALHQRCIPCRSPSRSTGRRRTHAPRCACSLPVRIRARGTCPCSSSACYAARARACTCSRSPTPHPAPPR